MSSGKDSRSELRRERWTEDLSFCLGEGERLRSVSTVCVCQTWLSATDSFLNMLGGCIQVVNGESGKLGVPFFGEMFVMGVG